MDHSIQERLSQRKFNVILATVHFSKPRYKAHHLINEGRYDTDMTWEKVLQLHKSLQWSSGERGNGVACLSRIELRISLHRS